MLLVIPEARTQEAVGVFSFYEFCAEPQVNERITNRFLPPMGFYSTNLYMAVFYVTAKYKLCFV